MNKALTERQERIIQRVASGEDWGAAARAEGCSDSYARVIGARMKKNPAVASALESIQADGRKAAVYDLTVAMKEANEVIAFAKKHKHPTAYFFAVRHRAHLSGLLIDRVEIATVDLTGALSRAEARVLNITPAPSSRGSIDWRPHIPGNPVDASQDGESDGQVKHER